MRLSAQQRRRLGHLRLFNITPLSLAQQFGAGKFWIAFHGPDRSMLQTLLSRARGAFKRDV
jgi:hypothetical protein